MVNKILIRTSDRKTLHKDRRSLGMSGENLQEVLLFCLDERIEGTGIVEVELPNGEKGMIEVERTEEGYELPVKSSLLTQTGFVKFQLRILHDNEEIFKSEIIALEVKDSINATETIPEQYPTWIDNLTTLKQELEKAESERVSNENERISAEKTRQENFTEMQENISSAVSNIKNLTEEYNTNAEKETKKFNDNAVEQTKAFNDNSDSRLAEYDKNHTDKMKEYDGNAIAKLDAYNENDTDKTNAYNDNTVLKEKAFNDIVTESTEAFNTNVEQKENEFEDLAEEKINEYNQVSAELTAKVKQVQAENESLKAENKLIKEQIPSATASGNSVHIEDSSNLDFDWKINGGHAQAITTQPENYIDDREARGKTILEATSLYLPIVNLKAGNGYYFKIFDKDNQILQDSRYLAVDFYDENKVKIGSGPLDFPHNFTEEVATKVKYAKIYYNGNDTDKVIGNIVIKKIGLKITSSVSADDIDMFVPDSPSLDYPSEIETVGSNVNMYNEAKATQKTYIKGATGITGNSNLTKTSDYIEITNDYYTVNYTNDSNTRGYSFFDKNKIFVSGEDGKKAPYTVARPQNAKYIRFSAPINANDVKLELGLIATPYSPFGMGGVEIDVVNKNLLNIANIEETTKGGIIYSIKNGILKLNGTATSSFDIQLSKNIKIKKGKYTHSSSYIQLGLYISFDNLAYTMLSAQFGKKITFEITEDTTYKTYFIWIDKGTVLNNVEIKLQLEVGDAATDFVERQSQTAIMPVQQEMLEGDYVADVEHHEWRKLVLTGNENFTQGQNANKLNYFYLGSNSVKLRGKTISNMLKSVENGIIWDKTSYDDIVSNSSNSKTINIMLSDTTITTLQQFKEKLKGLYDAGTPLILYFELATPINLELISEQKAVRDTKLYTYKNITNIILSDELASIDVEYKKDLDLEHEKLQNQIDEIRQLISTTETSALLLDNLQKDVETEVE